MKSLLKKILYLGSYLVPKKQGLWVFLPEHFKNKPLQGNLGMVLNYVAQTDWNIDIVCRNLNEKDVESRPYLSKFSSKAIYSIYSVYVILRAEILIIDTGTHIPGKFYVVQLWHGTGFKNIGFLNKTKKSRKNKKFFYSFEKEEKAKGKQIIFALSSSEADAQQKEISFQTKNVYITGSPVNDLLFKPDVEIKSIKNKYCFDRYKKVISFAPTYRDSNLFSPFTPKFLGELSEWLVENEYVFLVRKHPLDKAFNVGDTYKNIFDTNSFDLDLQSFLSISDLLISDYSSISTDYSLLNRPIVFYMNDFDEYRKHSRDFYFDLKEVLPGPFCYLEKELIDLIDKEIHSNSRSNSYAEFSKKFHLYRDGNSSKRTADAIYKIVIDERKKL